MTQLASFAATHGTMLALIGMLAARAAACRLLRLKPFLGLTRRDGGRSSIGQRCIVIGAAFPGAYLACAVPFLLAFAIGGAAEPSLQIEVMSDMPAAEAGLRSGDIVVSFDGHRLGAWSELPPLAQAKPLEPVPVVVTRNGEALALEVTPNEEGRIGITSVQRNRTLPVGEWLGKGFSMPLKVVARTTQTFWQVATHRVQPELMGPVGIVAEAKRARREGWATLLGLMGTLAAYSWLWLAVGDGIVVGAYLADRRRQQPRVAPSPDSSVFE